jgi:hypothetical protein
MTQTDWPAATPPCVIEAYDALHQLDPHASVAWCRIIHDRLQERLPVYGRRLGDRG